MSSNQRSKRQQQNPMPMPMPQPQNDSSNPMPVPQQQPKKAAQGQQQPMPVPQQQPGQQKQGGAQTAAPLVGQPGSSDAQMNTRFINNLHSIMGPPQMVQQRSSSQKQRNQSQGAQARQAQNQAQAPKDRLPSLHFGNLPEQFYDLDLFKFIKNAGHKVHKAFVVQDKKTQKNAKYGYAQFLSIDEAKKCLNGLNNAVIDGTVITVSLQQQAKPNPKANVFVRNLPTKVTQQEIFELYSAYGPVVKSKLECYADNTSRGFAYVQFENEKDAASAIAATNGMEMQGKKLEVFAHEKKKPNQSEPSSPDVVPGNDESGQSNSGLKATNNIFVQGLPRGTDEDSLKNLFTQFGAINSALVQSADSEDPMSNNGFVCFSEAADAAKAMHAMHKRKITQPDGKAVFLLVQPHVAKRENDMTTDKARAPIQQNMKKCFDSNLFVRNIPTDTDQEQIEEVFGAFGTIISVKVKCKKNSNINAPSRFKYAFVLYETVDMAQAAIRSLDQTRPFGLTPIEVEFWVSRVDLQQEREDRQKQEMKRLIQSGLNDLQAQFLGHPTGAHGNHSQGHQGGNRYRGGRGQQSGRGGRPQTGSNMRGPNNQGNNQNRNRSQNNKSRQFVPQQQQQNMNAQQTAGQAVPNKFTVELPQVDQAQLAAISDPNERKQLVGNAIYSAVQPFVGDSAGKITGMLLDENVVDLARLTSDKKYLSDLVNEAWRLLGSQSGQQPMQQLTPQHQNTV